MIEVMDKLWLGLVLQSLLLLSVAWRGRAAVDSSLIEEQYLMHKEDEVRLLATDALRLALDRQDCGRAPPSTLRNRFKKKKILVLILLQLNATTRQK